MNLPAQGEWKLYDIRFPGNGPLGTLTVDLQNISGTLQYQQQTSPLTTITRITATRFGAKYNLGRFQGILEGESSGDGSLEIKFLGGITSTVSGRPVSLAPFAEPTPKEAALALVEAFEQRTGRGAFPHLSRHAVARDLRARIANPGSLDQAQSSFCGPAAFMFCYLENIEPYTKYVIELYETGRSSIGSIHVKPSNGFRFDPLPWDTRPADWIALGSLRDSENWLFEYHRAELPFLNAAGDIELVEEIRGGTSTSDMLRWFSRAGYTKVEDFTGADMQMSKAQLATEYYRKNFRVCLSIGSNMLGNKTLNKSSFAADHWVALTSPIAIGSAQVSFTIYTWANKNWAVHVTPEQFSKNFYGFVAAGR